MLDRKGQALIEFVLILPILIMLIFAVIDFGNIFINKNELENALNIVNSLEKDEIYYSNIYQNINYKRDKKIEIFISNVEEGYITIEFQRKIDIITPGLNLVLDDPYTVSAKRVIKYE